ncbi:target of Nesh-SH3-like isoform X2 [Myxocyprinus asiaticus]|uniref:target of Nesh-SH3-like isoform X2 n=1 Tax=Myxocyprinus asiaticus TaxID=70543 RepID=UPI002222281F|nr:target of Nesh-SH3-like isoform X2 [Myxocyprinus asiaticus]
MQAFLLLLFLSKMLLLKLTSTTTLRGQRQNMKVRISAVGDTIIFKFMQPQLDTRLEGYILGYGSSMFSKQFIQLPKNGEPYETEIDAEPKYLLALQSVKADKPKKECTGKVNLEKPLHLVIGSVTPTSVLLSWGTILTTSFMDSILDDCIDEGQFTVRYREKEPSEIWNYQTCPTTSTVIDNLKPDALYEFEVRADTDTTSGVWSPPSVHNTADQIINEPFEELNQAKPEKPVLPGRPSFLPPVPVLYNITQTRALPTPLLRQTALPEPWKTSGAGNPMASSISHDDLPSSTQALPSTPTPIILPTRKTTSIVEQPKSQPSTNKPDRLIKQQHISIIPQQPTTTHQPSSTLQQTSTSAHSTTQQQPSTTQEYSIKTQIPTKEQPHTTKQQTITTQQQFSETTSNTTPTQNPPTTKLPLPQIKPQQHTTNKVLPSTVQEYPNPSKEQDSITQDSRHKGEIQPSTPRSQGTSKHQTINTYHFPRITSHYPSSAITLSEQQANTKPPPRTHTYLSTNGHSPTTTSLTPPITLANRHNDYVSLQTTDVSKQPIFSTWPTITKEYSTNHLPTTKEPPLTENEQELTPHPIQLPTPFRYQPKPSTTTQHSSTVKQQTSTAKYNPKTESHVANLLPNPKEQLPTLKPKKSKPLTIFDAIQNSPVAEKVTEWKNQPGGQTASSQPKDEQILSWPTLTNEAANRNQGRGIFRNSSSVSRPLARNVTQKQRPHARVPPNLPTKFFKPPPVYRNSTLNRKRVPSGERHIGLWGAKTPKEPRKHLVKTKLNQASETKEKEKVIDLKQVDPVLLLKPLASPTTEKTANREPTPTTPPQSAFNGDNSSGFSPHPVSEVDAMGKTRFVAPHVIYRTDKRPEEPCSVTHSLSFFPDEEVGYLNVTGPPKTPPSNLTVVTVEGCPSFIVLDWKNTDNETTEYEVSSSTKGLHGEEVSILITNQTHTAVENLKPESSYEFKVTPKNELGSGPASDPVSFNTESADPRVSEVPTGKTAIWSSFPFKSDSYSECNGRQFIKRTWYRKFVGIQLCNSLRYKIYLSDSLTGKFYNIGDQTGYGEDHCQFVDSFLDGRTGGPLSPEQLPPKQGYFRAMRQEPVRFGEIGGNSQINYVAWYECGIPIPGKW